jgi:hypothetical protein
MSQNSQMTITEFLEARIAADERAIMKLAETDRRPVLSIAITVNHPQRLLAECAAKRAIIAARKRIDRSANDDEWSMGYSDANYQAITALAAVYADHPDYQREWEA